MHQQVFKIDQTQLNKVRNKAFLRAIKIIGITMLIIAGVQYLKWKDSTPDFIWPFFLGAIPLMLFPAYLGANKLKRSYSTLEIALNDAGIESKAEMMPYKAIQWGNIAVQEKADGITILNDKSVSGITRWFNGAGRIIILPEMLHKDVLIAEIYKHTSSANYQ